MLNFDNSWRFDSPGTLPSDIYADFFDVILKVARSDQKVIEHFKRYFASVSGNTSSWSSNTSWAESDLMSNMTDALSNAPLFIEAFYDACESLKSSSNLPVPSLGYINKILLKHNVGYEISPPNLITISEGHVSQLPQEIPISFDQKARDIIQTSFSESQKLLSEGRYRQAVQEILWLLETVSTAFQGIRDDENRIIEGKYFNKIINELKRKSSGTALEQIINWINNLHGYLSAPSGGGIRHGQNLKDGVATSSGEARLYCNLITSYISFLLLEHEKLSSAGNESDLPF